MLSYGEDSEKKREIRWKNGMEERATHSNQDVQDAKRERKEWENTICDQDLVVTEKCGIIMG